MIMVHYFLFLQQGGLIARALFTLPDFDPNTVYTIVTQATPHQGPGKLLKHCTLNHCE
jgi:hypothetical protein